MSTVCTFAFTAMLESAVKLHFQAKMYTFLFCFKASLSWKRIPKRHSLLQGAAKISFYEEQRCHGP